MKTVQITLTPNVRTAFTIVDTPATGYELVIYNESHSSQNYVSIGDSTVTAANGIHLYGGEKLQLKIGAGEVLHGISVDAIDVRLLATCTD